MPALTDLEELIGFFSYSRDDDADSQNSLSKLRMLIQNELRTRLGRSSKGLRLWQDREAIPPGTMWERQINIAIDQSSFFIPIITPRVINSKYCGIEFERFLNREKELKRDDLVFPILYVDVDELEDERTWREHPVLRIIGQRQYVDWRDYRYEPDSPALLRAVSAFCAKIAATLRRSYDPEGPPKEAPKPDPAIPHRPPEPKPEPQPPTVQKENKKAPSPSQFFDRMWAMPAKYVGTIILIHVILDVIAMLSDLRSPHAELNIDVAFLVLFVFQMLMSIVVVFANKYSKTLIVSVMTAMAAGVLFNGLMIYFMIPFENTRLFDTVPTIAYSAWTGILAYAYAAIWVWRYRSASPTRYKRPEVSDANARVNPQTLRR